jgi:hypothetical protein
MAPAAVAPATFAEQMPLMQTLILLPAVSAPVVSAELRTTPTVFRSVVAFAGRTKIDLSAEVRPASGCCI